MARISVAMCTYNGERYLPQQLTSIAEQTLMPWELVVCDDGSTDSTISILKNFAAQASFPIRIIRNTSTLGSTKNFQQCIELCEGEAIALSDQDDLWIKEKLERLNSMLEQHPTVGAIFSDASLIDSVSRPTGEELWARMLFTTDLQSRLEHGDAAGVLLQTPVVTGATMIFRTWLRDHAFPIPEPWVHDAWLAWICAVSSRLVLTSECLTQYRLHGSQQLGLPVQSKRQQLKASGLRQMLKAMRQNEKERYLRFSTEFNSLWRHLELRQMGSQETLQQVRRKVFFADFLVKNLAKPRLVRLLCSIPRFRDYHELTPHRTITILRHALL